MFVEPRVVTEPSSCWFYHVMDDVPGTESAPWDLRGKFAEYIGHVDMAGKRVLDVGCASGFLSFEAERAGAEVVSFEMDSPLRWHLLPFHESLYYTDPAAWATKQNAFVERLKNGYWLAHRALGSKAKAYYGDVYDLPAGIGQFDIALVGAVLEHLSDPMRALASIAKRTTSTVVVNAAPQLLNTERRIAHFLGDAGRPQDCAGFWLYSLGTYRHIFAMLGFNIVRVTTDQFLFPDGGGMVPRAAIVAERGPVVIPHAEPEPAIEVGERQAQLGAAATQRTAQLEAEIVAKSAELAAITERTAQLEAEVVAKRAELAAITASRSWRLTRPMRRLNAMRRAARQ